MDITTFAAIGGALLLVLLAVDVFLAIFHYDHSGLFLGHLHHFIWKGLMIFSRIFPRLRRSFLPLAGPLMMLASFVLWITLFIFGFAFVFWPWMDGSFRADSEIQSLGFIEALYFRGSTGTVLGYGDITPLSPFMKILDTTIISFKLTLYQLQTLQEKLHQFPILDLYYRSLRKWRDPEMLFLLLFETSVGARLAAAEKSGLRFMADSLEACLERLIAGMESESFKGTSVKDDRGRDMATRSLQEFQKAMGSNSQRKTMKSKSML